MQNKKNETAVLGGGCFWCTAAIFSRLKGVRTVVSGYAGGSVASPTYDMVSSSDTGHAEVIQVEFNPHIISYAELLDVFWKAHDPTTLNQQGLDIGSQYRSIILYENEQQKQHAEQSKHEWETQHKQKATTEIHKLNAFYPAEQSHQEYFQKHPSAAYCKIVVAPKLLKISQDNDKFET